MVINKRVPLDTATATLFAPGTIVRMKVTRPLQTVYNKISGTLRHQTFSEFCQNSNTQHMISQSNENNLEHYDKILWLDRSRTRHIHIPILQC